MTMPDWKIDRNISLSLLLAVFLQFGATVWAAASLFERVRVIEEYITATSKANVATRDFNRIVDGQLVRHTTQIDNILDRLDDIEDELSALRDTISTRSDNK